MSTPEATAGARQRVEQAAQGLVYISESDAPFTWVQFPAAESLDAAAVARLAGVQPGEVEERPLERFFAGHIEKADPADPVSQANVGRYRALRDTLQKELAGVRAYRIGQVNLRCLLVGRLPDGTVGGLETQALET